MLNLPKATELSRALPKKAIYAKFDMNTAARERFDAEISRIMIVQEISPHTTAIAAGAQVQSVFVFHVLLKRKAYSEKVIAQLSKLIPQHILFVLQYGDECRLAVQYTTLLQSPWMPMGAAAVTLEGLDLDAVWEHIVMQVGDIRIEDGNTLAQQIETNGRRAQLQKELERIQKQLRQEKQPRRKYDLMVEERKLKEQMESI